jgi:hypothetical protein
VGTPFGLSFTVGYLNDFPDKAPRREDLAQFLKKHAVSFGGGCIVGLNYVWSPGSGTAREMGFMTPGLAVNYTYTFDSPLNNYGAPVLGSRACARK